MGYRGCFHQRSERQAFVREINLERCWTLQAALYQRIRKWVFDVLLKRASERPRAVISIRAGSVSYTHLAPVEFSGILTGEEEINPGRTAETV